MADLKFTECENLKDILEIKSGELTDYMFMMYRKGEDGWYKNSILPSDSFGIAPMSACARAGLCATVSLPVTLDKDGKLCFFKADSILERLCSVGKSLGLESVDAVNASFGFRELLKTERRFVDKDCFLIAHFNLFSMDNFAIFPTKQTLFTISLEYRKTVQMKPVSLVSDVCPVTKLVPFTAMYNNAVFGGDAYAAAVGCDGTLWLDCVYKKYVVSTSKGNIFLRLKDKIIMPKTADGFINDAVIKLINEWGIESQVRSISLDELVKELGEGSISEAFCVSDTDGICPVERIETDSCEFEIPQGKLTRKLADSIRNLQKGVLTCVGVGFERI